MKLAGYMDPQGAFAKLNPSDKQELLAMLAGEAARRYPGVQPDLLRDKLIRREKEGSTGIGLSQLPVMSIKIGQGCVW